jgi:hypothetical protein
VITTASPAIRCPIASLPQCPAAVAAYGKPTYQLEALRAHLHDSATLPSIADDALATMELIDARHRAAGLQPRPRTPRMQPPGPDRRAAQAHEESA